MAENKTLATGASVEDFLDAIADPVRRADARIVRAMMERVTGEPAMMWGPTIVGFGSYRYQYDSGRQGEMCRIGFSPRKAELVLYVLSGSEQEASLLARLGKHRTGKSCLYIRKLGDTDPGVLEQIVIEALARMDARHPR